MPINRPPTESQPRPHKAVDVLQAVEAETESNFLFDPKKDISEESKTMMFVELERLGFHEDKPYNFKEEEYNLMKMNLSVLYPHEVEVPLSWSRFKDLRNWVISRRLFSEHKTFAEFNAEADVDFEKMKIGIEEASNNRAWWRFSAKAAYAFLMFQDCKPKLDLGEFEFNIMKGMLDLYRRTQDWLNFGFVAVNLAILSADRVEFLKDGKIKLIHEPKKLVKDHVPLPVRSRV